MFKKILFISLTLLSFYGCKKKTEETIAPAPIPKSEGNELLSFAITSNKEIIPIIDTIYNIIYLIVPHDILPNKEYYNADASPNARIFPDYRGEIDLTSPKTFFVKSESGKENKYVTKNIESKFSVKLTTVIDYKNTNNPADYSRWTHIYSSNNYKYENNSNRLAI